MSSTDLTFVIVGAGQAGGETALELRKQGFPGRIILVGEEPHVPYRRPPLSKSFLSGASSEAALYLKPQAEWSKLGVELMGGVCAIGIDRSARQVLLENGHRLPYDKLVLATGGRARQLMVPGADLPNVFTVRGISDVLSMRPFCQPGKCAVVVGGGFIGLETAAVLARMGLNVTVLEGLSRLMVRVTAPEVSSFFERVHREAGVQFRYDVRIKTIKGQSAAEAVELADETLVPADLVIVGIGQVPNVELAIQAGLVVDNGIVVDAYGQSSDPDIYAVGDCSNHPNTFYGCRLRLESVQNAMEHGRAVATTLAGKAQLYDIVPWFWSDQYEHKLQMVGLSHGHDQIIMRGSSMGPSLALFYLKDDRVIAVDTVGMAKDFLVAKKLVAARAVVRESELAKPAIPLSDILARSSDQSASTNFAIGTARV